MNVASLNQTVQAFVIQLENFYTVAQKAAREIATEFTQSNWDSWRLPIEFTPLQLTLLEVLLVLLLGTVALIWYSWHTFGTVITEKFVRPSTLKEIEELKLSVAKLKLPKEHSPRI